MNEQNETALEHQLDYDYCLNCGEDVKGDKFCSNCGQKRTPPEHLTVKHFFKNTLKEAASLDSKFLKTFKNLFFNPGGLTKEYLDGHKQKFISPVKIYLIASAIFFFSVWGIMFEANDMESQMANPQNAKVMEITTLDTKSFVEKYTNLTRQLQGYIQFLSVTALGLVIFALYFKKQTFYVEHLVFALHYKSFTYLSTTAYALTVKLIALIAGVSVQQWMLFVFMPIYFIYLFMALKKVYEESIGKTALNTGGVFIADLVINGISGLISGIIAFAIIIIGNLK